MPLLRITKHGEAVLKKPCPTVDFEAIREGLPTLIKDMLAAMYAVRGVGLAAPQVGLTLRLAVIDVRPDGKRRPLVLINPEIISKEGSVNEEEGCLSLPGLYAPLKRYAKARIRALGADGKPYEMSGLGLLARAFQHEIDHLDGKLFIDRLDFEAKLKVMAVLKDLRTTWT